MPPQEPSCAAVAAVIAAPAALAAPAAVNADGGVVAYACTAAAV